MNFWLRLWTRGGEKVKVLYHRHYQCDRQTNGQNCDDIGLYTDYDNDDDDDDEYRRI